MHIFPNVITFSTAFLLVPYILSWTLACLRISTLKGGKLHWILNKISSFNPGFHIFYGGEVIVISWNLSWAWSPCCVAHTQSKCIRVVSQQSLYHLHYVRAKVTKQSKCHKGRFTINQPQSTTLHTSPFSNSRRTSDYHGSVLG